MSSILTFDQLQTFPIVKKQRDQKFHLGQILGEDTWETLT